MNIIEETKEWIEEFVIKLNLCPFAKHPYDNQLIHYATSNGQIMEELLVEAFDQILQLDKWSPEECSTSFFVIDLPTISFDQLLQLIEHLEVLMETVNIDDQFQLVPFHPKFQFQEEARDALSNRVNQSPYPMVHILRSSQVEQAMKSENTASQITMQNDITLRNSSK